MHLRSAGLAAKPTDVASSDRFRLYGWWSCEVTEI